MKDRALLPLLLTALLAASPALAESFSITSADRSVRIRLDYPVEVELGGWLRVCFELSAFKNITVNKFRLKAIFYYTGGSTTLFDKVVLSSKPMQSGEVYQDCIEARVRLPTPPPEPHVELIVTLNYTVVGTGKNEILTQKLYITTVRDVTYAELERMYKDAVKTAKQYKGQVEELQDQVEELQDKIRSLENEISGLRGQVAALQSALEQARKERAQALSELKSTLSKLEAYKAKYEELLAEKADLEEKLKQLQRETEGLLASLHSYKGKYETTYSEYVKLKEEYDALSRENSMLKMALIALVVALGALAALLVLRGRIPTYSITRLSQRRSSQPAKGRLEPEESSIRPLFRRV